MARYWLGIDFGTSGVRAIAVDERGKVVANVRSGVASAQQSGGMGDSSVSKSVPNLSYQPPSYQLTQVASWRAGLVQVLTSLPLVVRSGLVGIIIDGTSATVVLTDETGVPVTPVLTYADRADAVSLGVISAMAPQGHLAASPTATLPKVWQLWHGLHSGIYQKDQPTALEQGEDGARGQNNLGNSVFRDADNNIYVMHQADLCGYWLHGRMGITDYHNGLKLGYDAVQLVYPAWLRDGLDDHPPLPQLHRKLRLPEVLAPGEPVGLIQSEWVETLGIAPGCRIGAGTTDSTAAFLASIAPSPPRLGMAVTSLGSTMVLKVLAAAPLTDLGYGVYSHRWDQDGVTYWLVGGASNCGGQVLRQFFSDQELRELSAAIDPQFDSPLDYYPLPQVGERFPVNDPDLVPRLSPRPEDPVAFLHGLFTSMARIEAQGYGVLRDLGAPLPHKIYTAGGGAQNAVWTQLRQRQMEHRFSPAPEVLAAQETEAAYGAALLARMKLG